MLVPPSLAPSEHTDEDRGRAPRTTVLETRYRGRRTRSNDVILGATLNDEIHLADFSSDSSQVDGFRLRIELVRVGDEVVFSGRSGIPTPRSKPLLDEAIDLANHTPEHCVVLQRP